MELFDLFGNKSQSVSSGAIISECKKYRYRLWRIWDQTKPAVLFIMHNPSKADEVNSDPTMTRCVNFAKSWGFGGIWIGNLSPYRATNPDDLKCLAPDELQPKENQNHVKEMMSICSMHILAYGNPSRAMLKPDLTKYDWHYLKLTKQGNPYHPLYLKSTLKPLKFTTN